MVFRNMKEKNYPRIEIDLDKLRDNIYSIKKLCNEAGIKFGAVVKGCDGNLQVAETMVNCGVDTFLSSRLRHLIPIKKLWSRVDTMLIRTPMLSEVDRVVEFCNISFNTNLDVLKALNISANRQGVIHKVILMADLGDLREGFWDERELVEVAGYIEENLKSLSLVGIGTNLGCYGSIKNTPQKMRQLCTLAEKVQNTIGRKLDYVSGGGTLALPMILNKTMPQGINFLRIGEAILLSKDLEEAMPYMNQDVFTLKMEVIEIFDKPTYPVGEICVDGFGLENQYVDRGIRKRALLAGGKVDYGYPDMLFPKKEKIQVIGASSDHTIVDVEECEDIEIGDVLDFTFSYAPLVYSMTSIDVEIDIVSSENNK